MSTDSTRQDATEVEQSTELRSTVERYDDAPDQCTIYPSDLDDHERMATWITASGPSFVDLSAVR